VIKIDRKTKTVLCVVIFLYTNLPILCRLIF
jgi:hypothetical protein